jgi:GT2 family glycosyltransferase
VTVPGPTTPSGSLAPPKHKESVHLSDVTNAVAGIVFDEEQLPVASIILVGWRDAPLLISCLESIKANVAGCRFEVLLVLNEPTYRLQAALAMNVHGVRTWRFGSNLGFGGAVNVAAAEARGKYIVLLNDDSLVESNWLESLVETAERRQCGAVGSTILNLDGTLQEAGSVLWSDGSTAAVGDGGPVGHWDFERPVDYCSGASLLVRRSAWEQLHGFDESYYPAYYEDVDLSLRLKQNGWEVWYQPISRIRHVRSASTVSSLRNFLSERNREVFVERWVDLLTSREKPGDLETAVWAAMGKPTRVLVIGDRMPDPSVGGHHRRMHDALLAMAGDQSLQVSFHPRLVDGSDARQYTRYGIRIIVGLVHHLETAGVTYEAVLLSRQHNAAEYLTLVKAELPHAAIVYDAGSLVHRRLASQLATAPPSDEVALAELQGEVVRLRDLETSLFSIADHTVCICEDESSLARSTAGDRVTTIEPWLSGIRRTEAPFSARGHLGLATGWLDEPESANADGLLWFAHQVLPLIRAQLPWVRLLVTGASPPKTVSWLQSDMVRFVGSMTDLTPFYEHIRVAVVPVRFGSGTKIKTIEAIQRAVPTVSTSEGVSGLEPIATRAVEVADDPREFAAAVVGLMTDRERWKDFRRKALAVTGLIDPDRRIDAWPRILHRAVDQVAAREGIG